MATWYLMNNIRVGTVKRFAGTLIDDTQIDTAPIIASGGKLEPSARAGLADASTLAIAAIRRGYSKAAESIMNAALDATQSTLIAAQDTVDPIVTGVTVDAGTTGVTVDSSTPVAPVTKQDKFVALSAPGSNYVAQYAGGAAIDDAIGPFTLVEPYPYRTAQVTMGIGGTGPDTVFTIDGVDIFGNVVQDSINVPAGAAAGTYQGTIAMQITRFRSDVDPIETTDLEVGNGFALSSPFSAIQQLAVDEALESPASVDGDSGTVVPTTAPNAARNFQVRYTSQPVATYMQQDVFVALSAPGTNYIAQYAAGAALDDAVGPFTLVAPYPYRTARIVLGATAVASVDYTIDGLDAFGNVRQEVITALGVGTYEGEIAWSEYTRFRSDIDPGGTTDLQVGDGFAVSTPIDTAIHQLAVDEVLESPVSVDILSGSVVPTTVPNTTRTFVVRYPTPDGIAAHVHTVTDPTHVHTVTDPTHIHNLS